MRPEDIKAISKVLVRSKPAVRRVMLLSGSDEEKELVWKLWPQALMTDMSEAEWNLYGTHPAAWIGIDLVMVCNTFMCSKDPGLWLDNIAQSSRYVLIQDLAIAKRRQDRHLAPETGDFARYSVSSHGIMGETDPGHLVYDLSTSGYRVIDCESYRIDDGVGLKFAALLDLSRKTRK